MFRNWRQHRRFRRSPAELRNLVFYAESRNDWHHFEPIIERLTGHFRRPVSYLTSDPEDFALARAEQDPLLHAYCIGEGAVRTWAFQMLSADLLVLTMMDLGNFQLKRSVNPVHYVYLFHAPGSTHMVDHANSYDHYDTLFCVGPHHERELRARERQAGMKPRRLVRHGYHRMEQLMADAAARPPRNNDRRTVLVAPTWGEDSTLNRCGEGLIKALLAADFDVVLRPHYMTVRRSPELVRRLRASFDSDPRFRYVDLMGESDSLFDSDLLVSDWSSISIEYALALEKPVLFVDVPKRVRNPNWEELGLAPIEISIRDQVGRVLDPARIDQAGKLAAELLDGADGLRESAARIRAGYLYNFGRSAEVAAAELNQLADELRRVGAGRA